jgi:hypothetical protein
VTNRRNSSHADASDTCWVLHSALSTSAAWYISARSSMIVVAAAFRAFSVCKHVKMYGAAVFLLGSLVNRYWCNI